MEPRGWLGGMRRRPWRVRLAAPCSLQNLATEAPCRSERSAGEQGELQELLQQLKI